MLDPEARTHAAALFDRLPGDIRREFVTPERLIAVLTAKDVPLSSATILRQQSTPTETKVVAQISGEDGQQKVSQFFLQAEHDRWRLMVPGNAVKAYAAWLQTPPASPVAGKTP